MNTSKKNIPQPEGTTINVVIPPGFEATLYSEVAKMWSKYSREVRGTAPKPRYTTGAALLKDAMKYASAAKVAASPEVRKKLLVVAERKFAESTSSSSSDYEAEQPFSAGVRTRAKLVETQLAVKTLHAEARVASLVNAKLVDKNPGLTCDCGDDGACLRKPRQMKPTGVVIRGLTGIWDVHGTDKYGNHGVLIRIDNKKALSPDEMFDFAIHKLGTQPDGSIHPNFKIQGICNNEQQMILGLDNSIHVLEKRPTGFEKPTSLTNQANVNMQKK